MLAPHTATAATAGLEWVGLFTRSALRERQVSASTLEAYTLDLAMLSRWAAGLGMDLLELSSADLTRYVAERAAQGIQLSTLARHLSSFRRFYSFLVNHAAIARSPAEDVPVPHPLRPRAGLVRDDVVRSLLRAPRRQFPSPAAAYRAQRDHAIVCMLYGTGLGISDVRLLRWQQVDAHWRVVRAPLRSGAQRSFGLDATLLGLLKALHGSAEANGLNVANSGYCFPAASGLPMTRQALCHVVRRWASECGQAQPVTPSAIRQTGRAHQSGRRLARLAPALA